MQTVRKQKRRLRRWWKMDFNRAMAKSVAWISTSMAVIAAISATKNPCCLFAFILPLFVGLPLD